MRPSLTGSLRRGKSLHDPSLRPQGGVVLAPQGHKTMVFEAFFYAGLGFPTVPLLERVLCHFYVELLQLSANAIVRLAIFEWAMRAEGCEG